MGCFDVICGQTVRVCTQVIHLSIGLWVLPQLIQIHEDQVLGSSGNLQLTVQNLAPHEIQINVDYGFDPLQERAGY